MNIIQTAEGWYIIEEDTHVGKWIIESKDLAHDKFLIPIAVANIVPGSIVIDCGALYGDHTIAYARQVGPNGCVIAIEANPVAFECLKKNAEKFQGPTICMNLALCDNHGGIAVHIMDEANVGASQVSGSVDSSYINEKIEREVRTASIDGIVHDANLDKNQPMFIKIDVEGWEHSVLLGAKNTLRDFKPILLIEINTWTLSKQGTSPKEIYDYLLSMNYAWRIVQPELNGSAPQYDIMAWPNKVEPLKLLKAEKIL